MSSSQGSICLLWVKKWMHAPWAAEARWAACWTLQVWAMGPSLDLELPGALGGQLRGQQVTGGGSDTCVQALPDGKEERVELSLH